MLDRETLAPLASRGRRSGRLFHELGEFPDDVHDLGGLDATGAMFVSEP